MNYYWIPTEQKVTQLDSATYDMWVETNNPKANYYTPIPDQPGYDYYYDGAEWVQYPAPPPPPLSRLGFLSRFTVNELIGIEVARQTAPEVTQRAMLTVLKESWMAANDIDVSDPRTVEGVELLMTLGLLTAERAAEIITP